MLKIPVYQPSLAGNEKKYVNDCLDSSWISSKGKYIALFENEFARYTGVQHAASVSNGTVALHLALLALGIGPGDEVIVPTLTYVASVNAISYAGATPVFVDSLEETWQMDPSDVEAKITQRTRAIMVVHLYGHPCDMERLVSIAKRHELLIVEDCAEAFGSYYRDKHVGSFGAISTYSFFGNKTITTGEGGMVVTNDKGLWEYCVRLRGQGLAVDREYWHDIVGYNYRMTNICAAIGLAQLEQADSLLARKRKVADWYRQELQDVPVVFHPEAGNVRHSYWMCSLLVKSAAQRDPLRAELRNNGIETRPLFPPIHLMPMYRKSGQQFRIAEDLSARGMNLPSWPELRRQQVADICGLIRNFLASVAG